MDSESDVGSVRNGVVKKEIGKQIKVVLSEREETTNLAEEVEEESMLLMMGCSSGDEHKQVNKSARRLSVINHSNNMERSSRCADSSKSLAENSEISNSPKKHEANLVSSVGSPNCLIKLVEQVECPNHSGEQVNISESLVGSLCSSVERLDSSDSSVSIVDSSDLEQEEQLCAEKDLRVVLEVQVEKWQLSDLLTRARPIQRNSVNDKLAIERIKNPAKGKSAKVKMKSFKEKIKSVKEESKSITEIKDCSG